MADPVKILSTEITLGTSANTVSNGRLIRVVNINSAPALITLKNQAGTTLGTLTLGVTSSNFCNEFILKEATDTLQSDAASGVLATSVGKY